MLVVSRGNVLKEFEVEHEGAKILFGLEPLAYKQYAQAYKWLVQENLLEKFVGGRLVVQYTLISRIKQWIGVVDETGKDLPCTMENKMLFAGQYPGVLSELEQKAMERETEEIKNLKAMQDGSAEETPRPAGTV